MDWHSGMNILLLLHTKTDVSFRALGTLVYSFLPLIERCQLAIVFPPGVVVFALNLMNSSEVSARASWFVLGLKNKIPSPPLPCFSASKHRRLADRPLDCAVQAH
jgi:hypothetical protein